MGHRMLCVLKQAYCIRYEKGNSYLSFKAIGCVQVLKVAQKKKSEKCVLLYHKKKPVLLFKVFTGYVNNSKLQKFNPKIKKHYYRGL